VGDPVLAAQRHRLDGELDGEFVDEPLDAEGRLRTSSPAHGVGGGLGGEHVRAGEPVGRDLVDTREHEPAEDGHARGQDAQIGAHVGEQLDLKPGDGAVGASGDRECLDLVAAMVPGQQ
jgi:hypothetical protein